jgi:hypothetical protein
MNQQIQELADEAEIYADSIVDLGGEFHPAYTQKLAELMIAEFSDVVKQTAILVAQTAYNDGESKADVDQRVNSALRVLDVMRERFKD